MFVDEQETNDVEIYYKKLGRDFEAYTAKEIKKMNLKEEDKIKYQILKIKSKVLTWGLYNDLQESAIVISESGERHFNYKLYKENRLKKTLKSWDAKDKEGKPVTISDNNILHLSPVVAETILRGLDEFNFVSEEEENLS
jgi:hypothetical protein